MHYILTVIFDGQKQYCFAWFRMSLAILFQQTLNTTMKKHGTCFIGSAEALHTAFYWQTILFSHVFPTYMDDYT